MAINLNPGADATLVGVAARAAESAAPKDYFKQFANVAENYQQTMMASADMWGKIITAGAMYAKKIKDDIDGPQKSTKPKDLATGDAASIIQDKLDVIKEGLKRYTGIWKDDREFIDNPEFVDTEDESDTNKKQITNPNYGKRSTPWSKESKEGWRKLQKERNDLFAELENLSTQGNVTLALHTDDKVDYDKTSNYGKEWHHALIRGKNDKYTDNGNQIKIGYSEDGAMGYNLYHDPNKITKDAKVIQGLPFSPIVPDAKTEAGLVKGSDGKPLFLTANQLNDLAILKDPSLETRYDKNNKPILGRIDRMFTDYMDGANGQPMNTMQRNAAINQTKKLANSQAAWRTPNMVGEGGKSWYEEMVTAGTESAKLFGQLQNIRGKDGPLEATGILSGVKDVDNVPGITQGDFQNTDNFNAVTLAMFNPGDPNYNEGTTAALYQQYLMNKIDNVRTAGWEMKNRSRDGFTPLKGTGSVDILGDSGDNKGFVPKSTLNYIGKTITNAIVSGGDGTIDMGAKGIYEWDKTKESYFMGKDVIKNKDSLFATIFGETFSPVSIMDLYSQIPDWDGSAYLNLNQDFLEREKKEKEEKKSKGNIITRFMNLGSKQGPKY